jgi:hypothetical protein
MATLYEILADAQHGDAMAELGREFGLTSQQTKAAVAALLPAISVGIKQSTATPEGLGHLFALAAQRPDLFAMYDDPSAAFSREGREAGNDVLATMFGSPEASRAVADQAQQFSGVTSSILKKLLPIIAGMILSGLMKSGSGRAEPSAPEAPSPSGGGLGDILRDMFGQGRAAPSGPASSPIPPIGDILGPPRDGQPAPRPKKLPPVSESQPVPVPSDPGAQPMPTDGDGQSVPGGDLLGHILRELEKGIREGRIKPVVVGPYKIDIPGQAAPSGSGETPSGGDILGQILRDMLGGGGQSKGLGLTDTDNLGAAIFGERIEPGPDAEPSQVQSFQQVLDRFLGSGRR